MTQATTTINFEEANTFEVESFALTFISDIDYEFVGGGTAVNNL